MNTDKSYLNVTEIQCLLPDNLKFSEADKISRGVYRTTSGKVLPVVNSKRYPNGEYWYSVVIDYYAKDCGAELICFIAGTNGIFLIPIDPVLNTYKKTCGWKDLRKGHSYYVRIKKYDDGMCKLMGAQDSNNPIYDVTEYFLKIN